jgi:hypothetical protein
MNEQNALPAFSWHNPNSSEWLTILSLPTLSWAKPFLPLTGLPESLLEQPELWSAIYSQMVAEIGQPKAPSIRHYEEYGERVRQSVKTALQQLANRTGQNVAVALEKWVWCHFFCQNFSNAMRQWRVVLSYAYPFEAPKRVAKQIPPPPVLLPILPDIFYLVGPFQSRQAIDSMREAAPAPSYKQIPYEQLEKCYEATLLSKAISQGMTFKAMQTITQRLTIEQRSEVVYWAQLQVQAIYRSFRQKYLHQLCNDRYLKTELPCSSILLCGSQITQHSH